jgi:hypothetical protein
MSTTAHLVTLARLTTLMAVVLSLVSLVFTVYRMVRIFKSGALSRRRSSKESDGFSSVKILSISDLDGEIRIEPLHGGYRTSQNTASSQIDVKIQQVKTPNQNVRVVAHG